MSGPSPGGPPHLWPGIRCQGPRSPAPLQDPQGLCIPARFMVEKGRLGVQFLEDEEQVAYFGVSLDPINCPPSGALLCRML